MTPTTRAFAGTAPYYVRYRPAYPDAFLATVRSRARATGHGAVLDLACGPGRIAIPMAAHFEHVVAVDVEPEMIAVGAAEARDRGVSNIDWRVGRAEDLVLEPQSVELITIGEAFHRLDRQVVLAHATRWLERGGALATLGGEPPWRGTETWKRVLVDVVNKWTGDALGEPNDRDWGGPVEEMRAAGFRVEEHESALDATWTCDSIVGFMYSTSVASRHKLGERAERFETELRSALLACEPGDRFPCRQRFGFTLGVRRAERQS